MVWDRRIIIEPQGDFELTVTECEEDRRAPAYESDEEEFIFQKINSSRGTNKSPPVSATAVFKISSEVLKGLPSHLGANSTFFQLLRGATGFRDSALNKATIKGDSVVALEVILRAFHDKMTDEMFQIPLEELWNV